MAQSKEKVEVTKIAFSIDGEWFTKQCRDLYIEGKTEKALAVLYHVNGLLVSDAYAILQGKKKLVSADGGLTLADDDAKVEPIKVQRRPPRHDASFRRIGGPDAEEHLRAIYKDEADEISVRDIPAGDPRRAELDREGPDSDWVDPLTGERLGEAPKPDLTFEADTGWLSPDGKLYPCEYHEHERLALQLGLDYSLLHGVRGWVHLNEGLWRDPNMHSRLRNDGDGEPPSELSQAQIDAIFDWCQKHRKKPPVWFRNVVSR